MAAWRIGRPQSRGTRPLARSNSASSGWSTSTTNARARAWSSSWAGVRVRSMPARMRHAVECARGSVACPGTGPTTCQATRSSRIVISSLAGVGMRRSFVTNVVAPARIAHARWIASGIEAPVRPRIHAASSATPASSVMTRMPRSRRVAAVCSKTGPSFALADATRTSASPTLARTPSTSPRADGIHQAGRELSARTATVEEVDQDVAVDRHPAMTPDQRLDR